MVYPKLMQDQVSEQHFTDAELVDQALQQRDSFELLVERYQHRIFRFIFGYCGDQVMAEDIAQEVFVKAYFALKTFDKKKSFSTWLFTLARNHSIDVLRKGKLTKTISIEENELDQVLVSKDESPDDLVSSIFKHGLIVNALQDLQPKYREVILLFYIQELSYEEIAEVIKKPLGTVKTHLSRAKDALKLILQEYRDELL